MDSTESIHVCLEVDAHKDGLMCSDTIAMIKNK